MMKVTVPVGTPVPGATGVTVAVNVTVAPSVDGSGAEDTEVVVADWTTRMTLAPVDGEKSASPL
ncbi:hypothetical protein SANTM175S_02818 [Streptomyces antimycoticus]